jgi:hypothetical protein
MPITWRQRPAIAYRNKAVTYDLLFKVSSETLLTIAADRAAIQKFASLAEYELLVRRVLWRCRQQRE